MVEIENINCRLYSSSEWTRRWFIEQLRFFVSGENLLTWTNYVGMDPETVDITTGIDGVLTGTGIQGSYPLARKFTIGVTLKF